MPSVVTANDLRSGAVVYLGPGRSWIAELDRAEIAHDAEALLRLEQIALAAVERTEVTAVYAMDVKLIDGRPNPVSVRERIRAAQATPVAGMSNHVPL